MKILSMTATFGKLEHETLTFQPGLNVIEAPNEWGKSTWCAFVVAMLYGISTSSRSKKDFLAEKERYAPWCGKPMSGRMELSWQGKNITIERSQKGRIPFGQFRAYETESNVDVPELTADNCGQMLLGVEREVFTRAGFLRGSDLPVVEDEALRRRLNALVTTGDESDASDTLAQKLKDLKNSCRFNRSGLLPQAEAQRDDLKSKLDQLETLKQQSQHLQQQEQEQAEYAEKLKNHKVALAYQRSLQTQSHLDKANGDLAAAEATLKGLDEACRDLPTKQTAQQELERLQQLQQQWAQLQAQAEMLPNAPQKPEIPGCFGGKNPADALAQAQADRAEYEKLCKPASPLMLILAALFALGAVALIFVDWLFSIPALAVAILCGILHFRSKGAGVRDRKVIADRYGSTDPESWVTLARDYQKDMEVYQAAMDQFQNQNAQLSTKKESLRQTMDLLTQGKSLAESLAYWQEVLKLRQDQQDAQQAHKLAQDHAQAVAGLVQTAPQPQMPDDLTLSEEMTDRALQDAMFAQNQLRQRQGQCQGQMEALGDKASMEQELERVEKRLHKLEEVYAAVNIAQETLVQASTELQRRFAPRISARAKELFGKLTGGRYDRLLLSADLSMEVAAQDEDTTHGALWRSDGTVDQLYLALRLAVAEELTPQAPLVLDDAFVRFDDTRVKAAMDILGEYAQDKQVILFTCHNREKKLLK